ncbi:MAG TPA: hypothetical protein VK862_09970 [Afifellaceae bacterium]|nr:hypothetical protein [Afifellaceae bacterium]
MKNIRPRYLIALAIMALACATIVAVSIRSSDQNARVGAFSDGLAEADEKLGELAKSALRMTARTGAARDSLPVAMGIQVELSTEALRTLRAVLRDAPEGIRIAIAEKNARAVDADPFKRFSDLIVQANQIFGGRSAHSGGAGQPLRDMAARMARRSGSGDDDPVSVDGDDPETEWEVF